MTSPLIVAFISFLVAILIVYIEARLLDNPHDVSTYIKIGLLVALVTGVVVYLMGSPSLPRFQIGGGASKTNGINVVDDLQEEMLSGYPNF